MITNEDGGPIPEPVNTGNETANGLVRRAVINAPANEGALRGEPTIDRLADIAELAGAARDMIAFGHIDGVDDMAADLANTAIYILRKYATDDEIVAFIRSENFSEQEEVLCDMVRRVYREGKR